jgi:hypothetical protein
MSLEAFVECHDQKEHGKTTATSAQDGERCTLQLIGVEVSNMAPEIVADLGMLAEDLTPGYRP